MKLIGLTGGIASGKSTIADLLRAGGVAVVDADQLARDAVAPGSAGLARIVETFGTDVLDAKGALDRPKMGSIVFHDDEKRRALNQIVHPEVARLAAQTLTELREAGEPVAVYEVPLLFENGLQALVEVTILVAVQPATQLARLMARDGLRETDAQARIDAQMSLHEKRALADHVLENDGDRAEARSQLNELWLELTGAALPA